MSPIDIDLLAVYNAEKARGIMHTQQWNLRMADLQRRFNHELMNANIATGRPVHCERHTCDICDAAITAWEAKRRVK